MSITFGGQVQMSAPIRAAARIQSRPSHGARAIGDGWHVAPGFHGKRSATAIDTLADHSDEIAERYLDGAELPAKLLREAVRAAVAAGRMVPVLAGAARRNIGIQPLLDAIVWYLPAPEELPPLQLLSHLQRAQNR